MNKSVKKRIGVIGLGQWGPNHVRNFFFHPQTEVVRICDKDPRRLDAVRSVYKHMEGTRDYRRVTRARDVDAVVVATPVSSHAALVRDALEHQKDVLCEKPLTLRAADSEGLIRLARRRRAILMVGHVFLFNPGILKLKEIIRSRACGRNFYLHAQRTNLGPVRRDANAVYDLASHDISIFNFLLDAAPRVVTAAGRSYLQRGIEDVAFISLEYPGGVMGHIHVSWLDPKKVRQITLIGQKQMVTWNDLKLNGPIEIYSKHVEPARYYKDYGEFHLLIKEGEIRTPYVKSTEPLKLQADHFLDCIKKRKTPLADGRSALEVVRVLEQIEKILKKQRRPAGR